MQKTMLCLWFDDNAEEAAKFYTSIFKNSKILETKRYGKSSAGTAQRPEGSVMTVIFELDGQKYMGLNGGPVFKFTPALSLVVNCDTQEELDRMWDELSDGGTIIECGWLTDKFGLSWQVVPRILEKFMSDPDESKQDRVMAALLKMKKLDIAELQKAYDE